MYNVYFYVWFFWGGGWKWKHPVGALACIWRAIGHGRGASRGPLAEMACWVRMADGRWQMADGSYYLLPCIDYYHICRVSGALSLFLLCFGKSTKAHLRVLCILFFLLRALDAALATCHSPIATRVACFGCMLLWLFACSMAFQLCIQSEAYSKWDAVEYLLTLNRQSSGDILILQVIGPSASGF